MSLKQTVYWANEAIASAESKGLYGCGLYITHAVWISLLFVFSIIPRYLVLTL